MKRLISVSLSITLLVLCFIITPGESCLVRWFANIPSDSTEVVKADTNRTLSKAVLKLFQMVIENETKTNFSCPESTGYFPHKVDCQLYYFCENSNFTQKSCEHGFGFDNKTMKCIPKEKVKLCQLLERTNDTEVKCVLQSGLKPHPADCRKFVLCVNWISYYSSCINNQYFDSKNNVCVPLKNDTDCVNSLLRHRENVDNNNIFD